MSVLGCVRGGAARFWGWLLREDPRSKINAIFLLVLGGFSLVIFSGTFAVEGWSGGAKGLLNLLLGAGLVSVGVGELVYNNRRTAALLRLAGLALTSATAIWFLTRLFY